MKLKDLLDLCKVTVQCGKCGAIFDGKIAVCPKCDYHWQEEKIVGFEDLRKGAKNARAQSL